MGVHTTHLFALQVRIDRCALVFDGGRLLCNRVLQCGAFAEQLLKAERSAGGANRRQQRLMLQKRQGLRCRLMKGLSLRSRLGRRLRLGLRLLRLLNLNRVRD